MRVDSFLELFYLKDLVRTGWKLRGVENPESVADHSWGTALLTLRYASDAGVSVERSLSLAVVHDLVEVRVGDIPRRADPTVPKVREEHKRKLEETAVSELSSELDWPEFARLWQEYDAGDSEEARFVRDMNLLDMVLQASLYARDRRVPEGEGEDAFVTFSGLDEFFETSRPRVATEVGRRLYREVEKRYRELR